MINPEGATPPKPDEDELTTYGTAAQRYEAATALRPDLGGKRYFQDKNTGEYVIRVSDLQKMAREVYGGSIERGWLDARMEALGWERRTLDGHARPGTAGRHGPHAKVSVYRGHLPPPTDVDPLTDGEEAGDAA